MSDGRAVFTAIVLAGGRGSRMHADVAKQYLMLAGHPVLYYALKAFQDSPVDSIVLVTGAGEEEYCRRELVEAYGFSKVVAVTDGGKERYDSVWKGLQAAGASDYVLIHDGARPFLDQETILDCMDQVQVAKACVAAVPVKDTIKIVDQALQTKETPDRSNLWSVQTPQAFSLPLAKSAYASLQRDLQVHGTDCMPVSITDDTMVVQYYEGIPAKMAKGSYFNIKITTPEDMILGEAILRHRNQG